MREIACGYKLIRSPANKRECVPHVCGTTKNCRSIDAVKKWRLQMFHMLNLNFAQPIYSLVCSLHFECVTQIGYPIFFVIFSKQKIWQTAKTCIRIQVQSCRISYVIVSMTERIMSKKKTHTQFYK